MSSNTDYYLNKVKELESNPVAAYQSQYGTQLNDLMNKITNRQPFSYDFNADPLYQSYKDQYTKLGKEASMNAVANASALTGGYGNSYATTAGAQANQQYLTQLNNIIPELWDAALTKYNDEGEDLQNQYNNLRNLENDAYSKYQQDLDTYNNALSYYQNAYQNQMSNDQWSAEYGLSAAAKASSGSGSGEKTAASSSDKSKDNLITDSAQLEGIYQNASKMFIEANRTPSAQTKVSNYLQQMVDEGTLTRASALQILSRVLG